MARGHQRDENELQRHRAQECYPWGGMSRSDSLKCPRKIKFTARMHLIASSVRFKCWRDSNPQSYAWKAKIHKDSGLVYHVIDPIGVVLRNWNSFNIIVKRRVHQIHTIITSISKSPSCKPEKPLNPFKYHPRQRKPPLHASYNHVSECTQKGNGMGRITFWPNVLYASFSFQHLRASSSSRRHSYCQRHP